jgi:hypothetical protein
MPGGALWGQTAQYGVESTYGTGVAATRIAYFNSITLRDERDPRPHSFMTGTREQVRAYTQGPAMVGGEVSLPLSADEIIELLLISIKGSVTPTTPGGGTNSRLWTFIPGNTLNSMTFEYDDGVTARRALGVYGDGLTIEGSANGPNTVTVPLIAKSRAANALTGSLTARTPTFIEGWESKIYIEAFGGVPGTTVLTGALINWNVSISNGLERKFTADNTNAANKVTIGPLVVTAELEFEAVATGISTEVANWEAVTGRTVRLEFGNNVTIEAALKKFVTVDLPGYWTTPDMTGEDANTRTYKFGLQAVYDPTTVAAMLQIRAQNARTAAW